MDLSAYVFDPFHEGAMLVRCRWAATKRVRARFYVSYLSTGEATVTFSHWVAAALRSLPAAPSERRCHDD
jgi:hypothetical protein